MRQLKLIMGGIWGLFAVATGLTLLTGFSWLMLCMTIGCGVLSAACFAEYHLRGMDYDDDRDW